ncbi:MAG: cation-translocating P-type ATPase [Clostridiales bacterium]|nr:cation-translocating P-type ATPase [Clostridiales bacterium]
MDKDALKNGLTLERAKWILERHGPNELIGEKKASTFEILLRQFKDFIVLVLLVATSISFFIGEVADAITIGIIIFLNGILGFIQEYRTEKSLEALKELSAPTAHVIREGKEISIPARDIVPGDILMVQAGDKVAADCVVLESVGIQVNESMLSGESVPVGKRNVEISKLRRGKVIDKNILYMGTIVTAGRAKALVTKTGMDTQMGDIASLIQGVKRENTPLQKNLDHIGKELVGISLIICVLIVLAGIYHGETIYNMILAGVALAVAAIPEGLPAIVTVSLAVGVQRMLKRKALIRKLTAVETLGSTDIICSDKTGTLTENRMTVKKIYINESMLDIPNEPGKIDPKQDSSLEMILRIGTLCNNAESRDGSIVGDPTEAAIVEASLKGGVYKRDLARFVRIHELPFNSDRKCMSVICRDNREGGYHIFVKGAPNRVIVKCNGILKDGKEKALDEVGAETLLKVGGDMAGDALRVLAFAYKRLNHIPYDLSEKNIEKDLIFVGFQGMIDPPRKEVYKAISDCHSAGIRPIMITGDHKNTAIAIARDLKILRGNSQVFTGQEIDEMNDSQLKDNILQASVFARVNPGHKLRIVRAYKQMGNVVAMTGDGVNDAPALKEADIGIAMGKSGTDVAKEASSMILLDDNFSTIVAAIEEGRIIFDNIRKSIRYLLSCNLGEMIMMAIAALFGMPLPLVPIQILWINLITDGFPALALSVDPPEDDIMKEPPRKDGEGIFAGGLGMHILFSGALIGVSAISSFAIVLRVTGNLTRARTTALITMILTELLYSFESRSERKNVFDIDFFRNKYLVIANIASLLLTLIIIYIPIASSIFKTFPLGINDWMIATGFSLVEILVSSITTNPRTIQKLRS